MHFTALFATVALAVASCAALPAQGAAAETVVIHSEADSSMCLDVLGNNPSVGQTVQLYGCNNSGAQNWNVLAMPGPQPFRFNGNWCLSAGPSDTTLQVCSQFSQMWTYNSLAATFTTLDTAGPVECLTKYEKRVFASECTLGNVNQKWTVG